MSKKIMKFAFHLSHLFFRLVFYFLPRAHALFPEHLPNHCNGLHCTFFKIFTKFDAVPLLDPSQNHMHQMHNSNKRI
jgi:hypothetical protein